MYRYLSPTAHTVKVRKITFSISWKNNSQNSVTS